MKLAVVGSRGFNDYAQLDAELKTIQCERSITEIISGGAEGADQLAERWAADNKVSTKIFRPDWKKFGKTAAIVRNREIVEACEMCVAFWDGKSRGTKSTITFAKNRNIPLKIIKI